MNPSRMERRKMCAALQTVLTCFHHRWKIASQSTSSSSACGINFLRVHVRSRAGRLSIFLAFQSEDSALSQRELSLSFATVPDQEKLMKFSRVNFSADDAENHTEEGEELAEERKILQTSLHVRYNSWWLFPGPFEKPNFPLVQFPSDTEKLTIKVENLCPFPFHYTRYPWIFRF